MNKSGIEWCDHTWNPITGCRHGCSYCYADKMSLRFCGNMKRNMVQTDQYMVAMKAFLKKGKDADMECVFECDDTF